MVRSQDHLSVLKRRYQSLHELNNDGKVLQNVCRTELLFTVVRTTLAVIVLGGSEAKFDRQRNQKQRFVCRRGLSDRSFHEGGSTVVQGQKASRREINNGPGFILIKVKNC